MMRSDSHQSERYALEDAVTEIHGRFHDQPESWKACAAPYCSVVRALLLSLALEPSIVFIDEPRIERIKALVRVMAFTASESMLSRADESILSQHLADTLGPLLTDMSHLSDGR